MEQKVIIIEEMASMQGSSTKPNLSLEATHIKLEDAHRIEKHGMDLEDCRTCRREFKRLIPAEVYQKLKRDHQDAGHVRHVFMCTICYLFNLSKYQLMFSEP